MLENLAFVKENMPLQRGMPTLGAKPVLSRPSSDWRKTEVMLHLCSRVQAFYGECLGSTYASQERIYTFLFVNVKRGHFSPLCFQHLVYISASNFDNNEITVFEEFITCSNASSVAVTFPCL